VLRVHSLISSISQPFFATYVSKVFKCIFSKTNSRAGTELDIRENEKKNQFSGTFHELDVYPIVHLTERHVGKFGKKFPLLPHPIFPLLWLIL
jgi:hypothetical protein